MMNNEELERKMEFIVTHHAKFVAGMDELREFQRETAEVVNRLAYVTNVGFKDLNAKTDALVDAQISTEATIKTASAETEEKLRALIASQIETQERFKETDRRFKETDAKLKASQIDTDKRFKETDAMIKALADSQKTSHAQTEKELRKLSDTVDRYIRNRTNNGTG